MRREAAIGKEGREEKGGEEERVEGREEGGRMGLWG